MTLVAMVKARGATRALKRALLVGAVGALAGWPVQAAESGSAADLLDALVTAASRGVAEGNADALPALGTYLDLPAPWRARVRESIERSNLPADARRLAAAGGADAARWAAFADRIDRLRGMDAYAAAGKLALGRAATRATLPNAVDGVQWLRIGGLDGGRAELAFGQCIPLTAAFDIEGGVPGRATSVVSYDDRSVVVGGKNEIAVRVDGSNCGGPLGEVSATRVAGEQALPANGRIGVGAYAVTLRAKDNVKLELPTRAGRIYEVLLAPVGTQADPGVIMYREGADEPFVTDDDGGHELGSHVRGVVGDGKNARVELVAVEDRGGPASLLVREVEAGRQAAGETRTYRSDGGAIVLLQASLKAGGAYAFRTAQLSEGVDTVVAVFPPGADSPAAENDDAPEMGLASEACLWVEKAGDHLVRISFIDATSGTFDFTIAPTEACPAAEGGEGSEEGSASE